MDETRPSCAARVAGTTGAGLRCGAVQRRFWPAMAPLPNPAMTGAAEDFARSAAVFFGFFTSRFERFCPFAM
jgi:hypothetical protein